MQSPLSAFLPALLVCATPAIVGAQGAPCIAAIGWLGRCFEAPFALVPCPASR